MKIGIVTTWFERGAGYVSHQYRRILESQHEVFIYERGESSNTVNLNWIDEKVTRGKKLPFVGKTAFDLQDFRRWLSKYQIEMVIFNEQHWWPPIIQCNNMGIKTGAYVDYYTEDTVPLFACYDFLLCNTRRHYSVFSWHPQCFHIPWGTDIDLFRPKSLEPIDPGRVVFFHSSGMNPRRKGTDLVVEAFAQLSQSTQLIIHSQVPLKTCIPKNSSLIDDLHAANRLKIYEQTVGAPGLYHLGDVYVYPSRLDGIGLTIAEAMACGLPVITTNHPPMNEFVIPDLNGLLVPVDQLISRADGYYWPQSLVSPEGLRQQMSYFTEKSACLASYKKRTRQYAEEKLNWTKNAGIALDIVREIKKLPAIQQNQANAEAIAFEDQRTTLPQRHPRIFYLAHLLYKSFGALRPKSK